MPPPLTAAQSGGAIPTPNTGGYLSGLFGGINDVIDGITETAGNLVEGVQEVYNRGGAGQAPAQAGPVVPAPSDDGHILGVRESYVYLGIGLIVLLAVFRGR